MITRILLAIVGALAGGWMLFDGVHVMLRGKYFGPDKPGPWSIAFTKLGINPFALGPMFIVFGVAWLICLIALLAGQGWAWYAALAVAIASLWYLPVGTVLAAIYIVLLFLR